MKILLAIDGSKQSDAAVEACAKFFKSVTQIKIISVVERIYAIGAEPYAVSAEFYAEVEKTARTNAEESVKAAKSTLSESLNDESVEISTEVFVGSASQAIIEDAENWKADLIIVGSHGYGFWERALLGSVSNSVVHHAPCSVLVIKSS